MVGIDEILKNVPDWQHYYTVDELKQSTHRLATEYPDKVEVIQLGESAKGEMIECLKIGNGRYNALIHGFPNTEEPYGGNLLDYFSRALVENDSVRRELDYTWYLIKCSDPDGARLNEKFQKGPLTPLNFTLNYYRTPSSLAPESCFPFRFGPLDLNRPVPETRALMKLLDRIPFDFVSSLHMMKWGGISYQLPHACPELYAPLQNVAKECNVFLRKRLWKTFAPGILQAFYLTPARNYLRAWAKGETNIEPIKGCFIYEYAAILNPNVFTMIPECCLWYDPRMLDDSPSDVSLAQVTQYEKQVGWEANQFMLATWKRCEPQLTSPSVYKTMMAEWMAPIEKAQLIVGNPMVGFDETVKSKTATVAEKIGMKGHADIYRMFFLGGLLQAIDHQLQQGSDDVLATARDEVAAKIKAYDAFLNENYNVVAHPIRNLVGMGIGSILHSAEYAKSRRP